MPQMVRFLALHTVIGIGASWFLLALLLWTDVNSVGSLIWASETPTLAVGMLAAAFAITFGGAASAAAVMMLRFEDDQKWRQKAVARVALPIMCAQAEYIL